MLGKTVKSTPASDMIMGDCFDIYISLNLSVFIFAFDFFCWTRAEKNKF